jgi:hypothetical protein
MDDVEKTKFLTLPGLELRPLGRPARNRCTIQHEPHRNQRLKRGETQTCKQKGYVISLFLFALNREIRPEASREVSSHSISLRFYIEYWEKNKYKLELCTGISITSRTDASFNCSGTWV